MKPSQTPKQAAAAAPPLATHCADTKKQKVEEAAAGGDEPMQGEKALHAKVVACVLMISLPLHPLPSCIITGVQH